MRAFVLFILFFFLTRGVCGQTSPVEKVPSHPRIILSENTPENVRKLIGQDSIFAKLHHGVLSVCEGYLNQPVLRRIQTGRRILGISREALKRIFYLSYAYRTTGRQAYADRARSEMFAVCEFPDWNPSHFLDVAEMAMAVSIGYDWLYDLLTEAERTMIVEALYEKAILVSKQNRYNSFYRKNSNWNQVCNSGLVHAAAVVCDNFPLEAALVLEKALKTNPLALLEYGPDGGYPEGYTYWGYGTSFQIMMFATLESAFGYDDLSENYPAFLQSGRFIQMMTGPTGYSYNFSDNTATAQMNPMMIWMAWKNEDPTLLWLEYERIKRLPSDFYARMADYISNDRLLPAVLVFMADNRITWPDHPPRTDSWYSEGLSPVFSYRSGWQSEEDAYLGVKGGTAQVSHSHMDVGSFVYEKGGVRWAIDLGAQDYHGLEERHLDLWNRSQHSERWTVFRLGVTGHSTLCMNGDNQQVDGYARFVRMYDRRSRKGVRIDMSSIYRMHAERTFRSVYLDRKNDLHIVDRIYNANAENVVAWNLVTSAEARILGPNTILLSQDGKSMLFTVKANIPIRVRRQDNSPVRAYDADNPGTCRVGFVTKMAPGERAVFRVSLTEITTSKL